MPNNYNNNNNWEAAGPRRPKRRFWSKHKRNGSNHTRNNSNRRDNSSNHRHNVSNRKGNWSNNRRNDSNSRNNDYYHNGNQSNRGRKSNKSNWSNRNYNNYQHKNDRYRDSRDNSRNSKNRGGNGHNSARRNGNNSYNNTGYNSNNQRPNHKNNGQGKTNRNQNNQRRPDDNYLGPLDDKTKREVSSIYNLGQVLHHTFNWDYLPASINKLFSNVKDTIHPARDFGNLIKEKIDNAIDVCAEHIRELMMSHYKSSVVFIACDMTTPSELSYNIALERLKKKYKLHGDFITSLHDYVYGQVDDAVVHMEQTTVENGGYNVTGISQAPIPVPVTSTNAPITVTQTNPVESNSDGTTLPNTTITTTANSYAQATSGACIVVASTTPITEPCRKRPLTQSPGTVDNGGAKVSNGTAGKLNTSTMAKVHKGWLNGKPNGGFELQVRADTNYLLIGDSNLRNMRITHDTHIKVQVECYPGLQIHHLSTLLKGLSGKPNLKHIYMFVGINDADNDFTGTIKKRIDTLHNNIRENGYQCTFVNAPTTGANGSLSVKASNNIKSINDHAKKTFTGTMQLPLDEVGDDGIHLTLAASNRLAQRISNSISGIEKSSIMGFMRQGHLN